MFRSLADDAHRDGICRATVWLLVRTGAVLYAEFRISGVYFAVNDGGEMVRAFVPQVRLT